MKFNNSKTSSRRKSRKMLFRSLENNRSIFRAPLNSRLKKKLDLKSIKLRKDDQVKIKRGVYKGKSGTIIQYNNRTSTVFIDSITEKKANQTNYYVPIHVSNILVVKFFVTRERTKFFDQKN